MMSFPICNTLKNTKYLFSIHFPIWLNSENPSIHPSIHPEKKRNNETLLPWTNSFPPQSFSTLIYFYFFFHLNNSWPLNVCNTAVCTCVCRRRRRRYRSWHKRIGMSSSSMAWRRRAIGRLSISLRSWRLATTSSSIYSSPFSSKVSPPRYVPQHSKTTTARLIFVFTMLHTIYNCSITYIAYITVLIFHTHT